MTLSRYFGLIVKESSSNFKDDDAWGCICELTKGWLELRTEASLYRVQAEVERVHDKSSMNIIIIPGHTLTCNTTLLIYIYKLIHVEDHNDYIYIDFRDTKEKICLNKNRIDVSKLNKCMSRYMTCSRSA